MKNFIFRCMWEDDEDVFHVHIREKNITEARKIFQNKMKKECLAEWCLLGVYREVQQMNEEENVLKFLAEIFTKTESESLKTFLKAKFKERPLANGLNYILACEGRKESDILSFNQVMAICKEALEENQKNMGGDQR